MKIRDKLFLGFGLYILLATVLGSFAYKELRTIGTRLTLVEAADDITNTILEVRRYEKNFLLYRDQADFGELVNFLGILKREIDNIRSEIISEIGNDKFGTLTREIADYELLITQISKNVQAKEAEEKMRVTAREIQSFTQNFSKKERSRIAATITTATNLSLFALMVIIILGTIVNIKLATSIATPIRMLEKITRKIAQGDFSEAIEVKGKDELSSLELAFNQMEENLRDARGSLEFAITKLREKQAQLVESEKLASVGLLAAGIAHEINNPLTSVLTFSNLILEQCPKNDPRCDKLKIVVRETERARNIVRQLLNFGREANIRPVRININRPVEEILESLIAQEAFKGIELIMNLGENLPDVYADPAQIGQVVLNLALNAIHAITPPGKLEVSTRVANKFVEIVFQDTGSGIAPEHMGKIFDPFFTTKGETKGTGLGLAVSYGIIKKHGGDIEVSSTLGKGTTFIVKVPVHG